MTELAPIQSGPDASAIESVVVNGDLSKLTAAQRVSYYNQVCNSLGLNPLTKPFDYINLNGRLTLYARKDATEQLRRNYGVSIEKPDIQFQDDWIIVTVSAVDRLGRRDSDIGVVSKKDMRGDFGNALMKAVTKAKRRVTLSICGLGMLDETEIETIPDAKPFVDNGAPKLMPRPAMADVVEELGGVIVEPPSAGMSLEMASTVTNRDGVLYTEIDSSMLANMANSITKTLKKNDLTPEDKQAHQFKLDAIRVILASRNQ